MGGVKKQVNNTYAYAIQGHFAARGPSRRTKTEAQRDGEAVALAKDREAAQKILKDLRAKDLRAKGKPVTDGRALGCVRKRFMKT